MKLEKAVDINLNKKDWNFNSASREWTNTRLSLTLKNHLGVALSASPL